jgi:hypothetical protein
MGSLEPHSCKEDQEKSRKAISSKLLPHFEAEGETFLFQIVAAGEA